jgi:hypothetical protein
MREIQKAFAKSIYLKVMLIKKLELTKKENSRVIESISDDIKKYSDLNVPGSSKNASLKAQEIGIELSTQSWHDQPKFDHSRKIFQYEHYFTVKTIREKCLKAMSEEEIMDVLKDNATVIWILKDEDKKLTALGYRSKRENPAIAYKEAGIEIERNPSTS